MWSKLLLFESVKGKVLAKLGELGDGLYLKRGGKLYDGSELLLGHNSPFKHIPTVGLLF